MSHTLIKIEHATKKIKRKEVLKSINLNIEQGKIYGFIGHNGSGKTMLFRLILRFITENSGSVSYANKDLSFGAILENPGFILDLSGLQNLKLLAQINNKINIDRIKETMTLVGLDPKDKKKVKTYSLGMKQKLAIAQAIMENPDVLILDEPTNGLDKKSAKQIREVLLEQNRLGKTILLSSHIYEDIEFLCDEIIELDNGQIIKHSINKKKHDSFPS